MPKKIYVTTGAVVTDTPSVKKYMNEIKKKRLNALEKIDIYPVTCEKRSNGRSDREIV